MLPRNRRVTTKLFKEVLKEGFSVSGENVYIKVLKKEGPTRLSFSVPKSVEKGAFKRNSLKRKGTALIEDIINNTKDGFVGVVFMKKTQNFPTQDEINQLLNKALLIENTANEE